MGLEELKQKIGSDLDREISLIDKETKDQLAALQAEKEKIIMDFRKKIDDETKIRLKQIEGTSLADAHAESANLILTKKREMIDRLVLETIVSIRKNLNEEFLRKLENKAERELKIAKLLCNRDDAGIISKISKSKLSYADIKGGIIAVSDDGLVSLDLSYESLIQAIKEKNITQVSKVLFNAEKIQ